MYTEEYERRGYPLLRTIIKIVLIILFIVILFWLFSKYVVSKFKTSKEKECLTSEKNKCDDNKNKSLKSQIFLNNITKMKEAAVSYYTTDRLPTNENESEKMTLEEMIENKLIIELIDNDNKVVDLKESYVKITKEKDEYILKVNLKDSEKEDYILVHLGCYSYCKEEICEKKSNNDEKVPTKSSKTDSYVPIKNSINHSSRNNNNHKNNTYKTYSCEYKKGKYYDSYGRIVSELSYIKNCYKPTCSKVRGYYFDKNGNSVTKTKYERDCKNKEKKICIKKNNKYYDINGNETSELNYIISCSHPVCRKVNGYYFDKNGNNVSKTQYEKSCIEKYPTPTPSPSTKPTIKCEYVDGKYYDNNGKIVSELNYIKRCKNPKCSIVNGYYFDNNGNNVSKSQYEKYCKTKEYIYEYQKVKNSKLSNWTLWSNWSKADCSTKEVNCSDNDTSCIYKLQMYKRKEKIGTYEKTYAKTRNIVKQMGSYKKKTCSKYNYIEINKTIYATTTTSYTTINTITANTQKTTGNWKYNGRASYSNPPKDTNKTHYVFVGADYSYCNDTCTSLPNYYYDSYTYTGSLVSVSSTTTPGITKVGRTSKEYQASCGEYIYKTIPIYGTIEVTEKATRTEPLYGTVCYKSTKSRNIITKGETIIKWSKYNDTSLLNNGYVYTGKRKVK